MQTTWGYCLMICDHPPACATLKNQENNDLKMQIIAVNIATLNLFKLVFSFFTKLYGLQ